MSMQSLKNSAKSVGFLRAESHKINGRFLAARKFDHVAFPKRRGLTPACTVEYTRWVKRAGARELFTILPHAHEHD
jgi:hypothetical protein